VISGWIDSGKAACPVAPVVSSVTARTRGYEPAAFGVPLSWPSAPFRLSQEGRLVAVE